MRCAVAGVRSAVGFSIACAASEIFASADASACGCPVVRAPSSSAAYSRVRLIAICTIMAAIGARITIASVPITPSPLLLSRWPPKNSPNCASMEMAPAMVAVSDMGELVGDHSGDFLAREHLQQSGRHRHRRVLGIASGCECIGLRIVHEIDARHRQAGAAGEVLHEVNQVGSSG